MASGDARDPSVMSQQIGTQSLNRLTAMGSGAIKKLTPHRISTVGIVQKVLYTKNTTIHNITTMVVPFAHFTAWDIWIRPIGRV